MDVGYLTSEGELFVNEYKLKMLSQFFSKLRLDVEELRQHPKFLNRTFFANRLTSMLSQWELAVLCDGNNSTSEEDRITREIIENSNELYFIKYLLANEPKIVQIVYEKPMEHTLQSIDIYLEIENGSRLFLDIKTIQPEDIDKWEQYLQMQCHLHGNIHLYEAGGGGEFWHKMFTARSRMLEYTIELENKLPPSSDGYDGTFMVYCSNGNDWHLDELEDFADFYNYGTHRGDDFFRKIEQFYMLENGINLKRNLTGFCYFEREKYETNNMKFAFNVKGPVFPW